MRPRRNMAKSINAIRNGFELQALLFWQHACKLYDPNSGVVEVGFEISGTEGFDDLMVRRDPPLADAYSGYIHTDYEQVKFRAGRGGTLTAHDLMDPAAIGATSESLLQKALRVQRQHSPDGTGVRFILRQPYPFAQDDVLRHLIDGKAGAFQLDTFMKAGGQLKRPTSSEGILRKEMLTHLGVGNDELEAVLRTLRIKVEGDDLDTVRESLNRDLRIAGLRGIDQTTFAEHYVPLIWKLAGGQREARFNRDQLEAVVQAERLRISPPISAATARRLGLRSFSRNAGYISEDMEAFHCCLNHFDNEVIRDPALWKSDLQRGVSEFFDRELRPGQIVHLALEAHNSIVFHAGHATARSSARVWPIQDGVVWEITGQPPAREGTLWNFNATSMGPGDDIAVGISVSQLISTDVQRAITTLGLPVHTYVDATIVPAVGRQSVEGPQHAYLLSQNLLQHLQEVAAARGGRTRFHIFMATPKALTFLLGQEARTLGAITLYEYDRMTRTYYPTLELI